MVMVTEMVVMVMVVKVVVMDAGENRCIKVLSVRW